MTGDSRQSLGTCFSKTRQVGPSARSGGRRTPRRTIPPVALAKSIQLGRQLRAVEHGLVDDGVRNLAAHHAQGGFDAPLAAQAHHLVGYAQGVRRQQDVIEFEQRIGGVDRLRVQCIEAGGADASLGQGLCQRALIDDGAAGDIDEVILESGA